MIEGRDPCLTPVLEASLRTLLETCFCQQTGFRENLAAMGQLSCERLSTPLLDFLPDKIHYHSFGMLQLQWGRRSSTLRQT